MEENRANGIDILGSSETHLSLLNPDRSEGLARRRLDRGAKRNNIVARRNSFSLGRRRVYAKSVDEE